MGIKYHLQPTNNSKGIGNLDREYKHCAETCTVTNELVKCLVTGRAHRRGVKNLATGQLYLCTDESVRSSRLFHQKIRAFSEIIPFVTKFREEAIHRASDDVHRFFHNLITLNAQTIQAIYRLVPQDDFNQKNRESLIRTVSKKLLASPDQTTSLMIDILKNANLEKTEFAVYEKLVEKEPIRSSYYPIHKIFMLVLNTYWDALKEKEVHVLTGKCTERVFVDYDIIAASLVHLLDNTTKYILPRTQLRISFETRSDTVSLVMDMVSLRIHPNEIDKIFREGFSGDEPKKIHRHGEGRGLYLVDRLLALTNSALKIEPDVDAKRRVNQMGIDFENNVFRLSMPRSP